MEERHDELVPAPPPMPPLQPLSILDIPADALAVKRHDEFLAFAKAKLRPEVDYGPPYRGSDQRVLRKPGAEKLTAAFRLRPHYEITPESIRDHEKPFFYFEVRCVLYYGDTAVGEGLGSANSDERQYRYRWLKEQEIRQEPDLAGIALQGLPTRKDKWKNILYRVPNTERHDLANVLLKMAKKRAMIDACLSTFGLSSDFTQDLDDMSEYVEHQPQPRPKPKRVPSQEKSSQAAHPSPPGGSVQRILELGHKRLSAMGCSDAGIEYVYRKLASDLGIESVAKLQDTDSEFVRNFLQSDDLIHDLRTENYMPMEK